jgi:hypothetical protein
MIWRHETGSGAVLFRPGQNVCYGFALYDCAPPLRVITWSAVRVTRLDLRRFRANQKLPPAERKGCVSGFVVAHDCGSKRAAMRALEAHERAWMRKMRAGGMMQLVSSAAIMGAVAAMMAGYAYHAP